MGMKSKTEVLILLLLGLLATTLSICTASSHLDYNPINPEMHVSIKNVLGNDEWIHVHCLSKNDDLGLKTIYNYYEWGFRFHVNLWGTTLYHCSVTRKTGGISHIVAYQRAYWDDSSCYPKDCLWEVRRDGLFKKNEHGSWDLMAHWS